MVGRGAFSEGRLKLPSEYKTVGRVNGVKVIEPRNTRDSRNLPKYSNSKSTAYIKLDRNGNFSQYRQYGRNHKARFDIDYHAEPKLGVGSILHIHFYKGKNRGNGRVLTADEMKKYGLFFKGII